MVPGGASVLTNSTLIRSVRTHKRIQHRKLFACKFKCLVIAYTKKQIGQS